ncbi:MAG: ABC transporter substrate-binding protein [Nocardioides sp.]
MVINRKPIAAFAAAAAVSASLAACGGGSTSGGGSSAEAEQGGTLYYLTKRSAEHMDPHRIYVGRDMYNMNRIVYRGLLTVPATEDDADADTIIPDIATDTGTVSEDAKTWEFTIRDGVKWQDGKPVTCEDFKYGISRTFATDVITGGPNYILSYIDIPKNADGLPIYNGPYKGDNQDAYDKAVTCDGNKLTLRFSKPWPDFNYAAAFLRASDPYREDKDQGQKSNYQIFSNGPYKLEGKWDATQGGTFVRNDEYDPASDESKTRQANPDKIVYTQGLEDEIIYDRLIADSGDDQYAITDRRVPPSYYTQITGQVADRSSLVDAPYVDYVLPNFNKMKNLKVRQALMLSTDKVGYITALGGDKAGTPAKSMINPNLIGYKDNPNFTAPPEGDPEAAKALLEESGEKLPYPITYTYQGGTPTSDKAASALADGWTKGGFKVTLDPLTDTYYDIIQKPSANGDVFWGGWASDWPSIGTVLPPLFDSRINFTENSNGQDYGNYSSDTVNKMIDEAALMSDVDEQAAKYIEMDDQLGKDVAYIPLVVEKFYFLRGSKVTNYINSPATSNFPDLGVIGVEN